MATGCDLIRASSHTRTHTIELPSHCEVFISVRVLSRLDWVAETLLGNVKDGDLSGVVSTQTNKRIVSERASEKKGVEHESSVLVTPRAI